MLLFIVVVVVEMAICVPVLPFFGSRLRSVFIFYLMYFFLFLFLFIFQKEIKLKATAAITLLKPSTVSISILIMSTVSSFRPSSYERLATPRTL